MTTTRKVFGGWGARWMTLCPPILGLLVIVESFTAPPPIIRTVRARPHALRTSCSARGYRAEEFEPQETFEVNIRPDSTGTARLTPRRQIVSLLRRVHNTTDSAEDVRRVWDACRFAIWRHRKQVEHSAEPRPTAPQPAVPPAILKTSCSRCDGLVSRT